MKDFLFNTHSLLRTALWEDLGKGDLTGEAIIPTSCRMKALVQAKSQGVLAGLPWALDVFRFLDPECDWETFQEDGNALAPGMTVIEIDSWGRSILAAERLALNLLMRLSGIATLTAKFVEKAGPAGIKILDTRKTTPLWRDLEKYAVRRGGGENHRSGLFDQVLIKDNHIKVAGSPARALRLVQEKVENKIIEIEVETLQQLQEILPLHPNIILLDNMNPKEIGEAVKLARDYPEIQLEISGGINLENISQYLIPGIHRISIGALTHSPKAMDFSLEVKEIYEDPSRPTSPPFEGGGSSRFNRDL